MSGSKVPTPEGRSVTWTEYARRWAETCPRGTNPPKSTDQVRYLYDHPDDHDDPDIVRAFMVIFNNERKLGLTTDMIDRWRDDFLRAVVPHHPHQREVSR